jgi:hypothetical protein
MNMKSIPPTAPAEQVVCGDAADGFQVKLIYPTTSPHFQYHWALESGG